MIPCLVFTKPENTVRYQTAPRLKYEYKLPCITSPYQTLPCSAKLSTTAHFLVNAPTGIRIRVTAVKGQYSWPLNYGSLKYDLPCHTLQFQTGQYPTVPIPSKPNNMNMIPCFTKLFLAYPNLSRPCQDMPHQINMISLH